MKEKEDKKKKNHTSVIVQYTFKFRQIAHTHIK